MKLYIRVKLGQDKVSLTCWSKKTAQMDWNEKDFGGILTWISIAAIYKIDSSFNIQIEHLMEINFEEIEHRPCNFSLKLVRSRAQNFDLIYDP